MLPACNRMRRSADFSETISHGVRAGQRDLVLHRRRGGPSGDVGQTAAPRIGLVVSKAVGNAVERHRVSRRLRHVAATLLTDLDAGDRLVIRALPGSRLAGSTALERQLRSALAKTGTAAPVRR